MARLNLESVKKIVGNTGLRNRIISVSDITADDGKREIIITIGEVPQVPKKKIQEISSYIGTIKKVYCEIGQDVFEGDPLVRIDSKIIFLDVLSEHEGKISEVFVSCDDFVEYGTALVEIEITPQHA